MTSDTYTPAEAARREAMPRTVHDLLPGESFTRLDLLDHTTWNDTPPVVLASLALAPRDEHGEVIGEGW